MITRVVFCYICLFLLQHVVSRSIVYFLDNESIYSFQDNFPTEILVADSCGLKDFRSAIIFLFGLGKAIGNASRLDEVLQHRSF